MSSKKYIKGKLIGFPSWSDIGLNDQEVTKLASNIKKQIQIQDVIPIIIAIVACIIAAIVLLG